MLLDDYRRLVDGLPESINRFDRGPAEDRYQAIVDNHLHEVIQLAAASRRKDAEIDRLRAEVADLKGKLADARQCASILSDMANPDAVLR